MKLFLNGTAIAIALTISIVSNVRAEEMPPHHGKVNVQLFLGSGQHQPLIVGIGGAEGGNTWTRGRWQADRDKFIEQGYAFLAIGYFGMPGVPEKLDRISINAIHDAILRAADNPAIDKRCIAIIGGSKGAELALLLASRYKEIKAVVAFVPANAVFVGLTNTMSTSSFSEHNKSLPFIPMTERAVPSLLAGDKRRVFDLMMEDKSSVEKALIEVEKINGPIYFLSAVKDELWASKEMSDSMMIRLKEKKFLFHFEHLAIDGSHTSPVKHMPSVHHFLNTHFKSRQANGCVQK